MAESLFEELKRYVRFGPGDEAALRAIHPLVQSDFPQIAHEFYERILTHEGASQALKGGESTVGRLKVTLVAWMDKLLSGPWDEDYFELRCRIGRVHVRIALPQHYMFGAMNLVRRELQNRVDTRAKVAEQRTAMRTALNRILDLELAIMLHTYREDLLAQQSRTERLSTFGQLVGSIGHELRNPLGVIESSLFILKGRLGDDERARRHVERIGEQVAISNRIVTSLMDMIHERPLARERLAASKVVEEALQAVQLPAGVRVYVEGLEGMAVDGDSVQLQQVFVNLLENAIQAAAPEGSIWVRGITRPDALEIRIDDSGKGVDPGIEHRLFEPLTTTKAKGIGLGLALVKKIVERHGGTISHAALPTGGASFILRLPGSA